MFPRGARRPSSARRSTRSCGRAMSSRDRTFNAIKWPTRATPIVRPGSSSMGYARSWLMRASACASLASATARSRISREPRLGSHGYGQPANQGESNARSCEVGADLSQGGFKRGHPNLPRTSTGRPGQSPNVAPGRSRSQSLSRLSMSCSVAFGWVLRRFWRINSTPVSKRSRVARSALPAGDAVAVAMLRIVTLRPSEVTPHTSPPSFRRTRCSHAHDSYSAGAMRVTVPPPSVVNAKSTR